MGDPVYSVPDPSRWEAVQIAINKSENLIRILGNAILPPDEMDMIPDPDMMFYFFKNVLKLDIPEAEATGIMKYSVTQKFKNDGKKAWRVMFDYVPKVED